MPTLTDFPGVSQNTEQISQSPTYSFIFVKEEGGIWDPYMYCNLFGEICDDCSHGLVEIKVDYKIRDLHCRWEYYNSK